MVEPLASGIFHLRNRDQVRAPNSPTQARKIFFDTGIVRDAWVLRLLTRRDEPGHTMGECGRLCVFRRRECRRQVGSAT
jgi:hypothetical protein